MSFALTNRVLVPGQTITPSIAITNSSTNAITVSGYDMKPGVSWELVTLSGKVSWGVSEFVIRPLPVERPSLPPIVIEARGAGQWEVLPVTIGKDIEPGQYAFKAMIMFRQDDKWFTVEAEAPVEVKVNTRDTAALGSNLGSAAKPTGEIAASSTNAPSEYIASSPLSSYVRIAAIPGESNALSSVMGAFLTAGIPGFVQGSSMFFISVPSEWKSQAIELLKKDAQVHKYEVTFY